MKKSNVYKNLNNDDELKVKLRNRRKLIKSVTKNSNNKNLNEEQRISTTSTTSSSSTVSTSSSLSSCSNVYSIPSSVSHREQTISASSSSNNKRQLNTVENLKHSKNFHENSSKRKSIEKLLAMRQKTHKKSKMTYVQKLTQKFEKLAVNYTTNTNKNDGAAVDHADLHRYDINGRSSGNSCFYVNSYNSGVESDNNNLNDKISLEKSNYSKKSDQQKINNNYKFLRNNSQFYINTEDLEKDKNNENSSDSETESSTTTTTTTTTTTSTTTSYESCDMSDEIEKQQQQQEEQSENVQLLQNIECEQDEINDHNEKCVKIPDICVEELGENEISIKRNSFDRDRQNDRDEFNQCKKGNNQNESNKRKSDPIPKSNLNVCEATNRQIVSKSLSYYPSDSDDNELPDDNYSLSSSKLSLVYDSKDLPPIIEELIHTEESYIKNLKIGIQNYGNLFKKTNYDKLPNGLKGKKWVLLGNIEQICEFHDIEFLPMLLRNQFNLKNLFDEFMKFIDEHYFYSYVLYTMNRKRSLRLCDQYRQYFESIQAEIGDKLGVNSFLVQPIQRLARYPLLLQQFIMTCFKTGNIKYKPVIESCCKVEKRVRNLLITTNEAEEINDIEECNDIIILHQGKFKKMNEFTIYDYTQRRSYRSKAFIFDKCLIYTEIRDKRLLYRGYYPCELIGFIAKTKSFTLYYHKQKIQECEFTADKVIIDQWIELIKDMINVFAEEEKRKLKEKYTNKSCDIYRRTGNVLLLRNSSRLSTDSGTGSVFSNGSFISVSSTSSLTSASASTLVGNYAEENSPKTTWYDYGYDV